MAVMIGVFIVLALVTGEWVFLFLGFVGAAAGAVPLLDRRK